MAAPALGGLLLDDDVELLDRRLFEELARVLAERLGDVTGEVRLAPVVVSEGIEDPERRRSELEREPPDRLGLAFDDRQSLKLNALDTVKGLAVRFAHEGWAVPTGS